MITHPLQCPPALVGTSPRSSLITGSDTVALGALFLLLHLWAGTTAIPWGPVRLSTPFVDKVGEQALPWQTRMI